MARGRGHDGLVSCVRVAMSRSVSKPKTFVATKLNAIYSIKFSGHDTFVELRTKIRQLFLEL